MTREGPHEIELTDKQIKMYRRRVIIGEREGRIFSLSLRFVDVARFVRRHTISVLADVRDWSQAAAAATSGLRDARSCVWRFDDRTMHAYPL